MSLWIESQDCTCDSARRADRRVVYDKGVRFCMWCRRKRLDEPIFPMGGPSTRESPLPDGQGIADAKSGPEQQATTDGHLGEKLTQPVHLYVKTHRKTGLKYFGRTVQDPAAYPGSGAYWTRHLDRYGNDVATQVIGTYYDEYSLRDAARTFSIDNDVATNPRWANLLPEDGSPSGEGWAQDGDQSERVKAIDRFVEKRMGVQEDSCHEDEDSRFNKIFFVVLALTALGLALAYQPQTGVDWVETVGVVVFTPLGWLWAAFVASVIMKLGS